MIVIDRLLVGGIRFVLDKLLEAAEAERSDDSSLREELLAAQMQLELGEVGEAEYAEREREILARIREVRERTRGTAPAPGAFRVTGVEASFEGDEHAGSERTPRR